MAILVKNNLPRVIGCAHRGQPVMLLPGVNPVSLEQYETLRANPVVLGWFDRKELEVLTVVKEPKTQEPELFSDDIGQPEPEQDEPFDIGSVSVRSAASIIAETYDVRLLREWRDSDERSSIKSACEKQLRAIDEAGPKAE